MPTKNILLGFLTAVLFLSIVNSSCTKNLPDILNPGDTVIVKPPVGSTPSTSIFIGHKGAGSNNYNDVNMEHSIASFNEALKYLKGVEIDAQMSLDGTIWMFHDVDINFSLCNPKAYHNSILTLHDNEIAALELCHNSKKDRVYKLSELIDLWNKSSNGFYIDLEIKTAIDTADYRSFGGEPAYLVKMAASMNKILQGLTHSPKLLQIDDYSVRFSTAMKKYAVGKTLTYMLNEDGTFEENVADAIAGKFDGVIHKFTHASVTAASVRIAHEKGLLVSLFSPYTDAEVLGVYNMLPDFIDTDHTTVMLDLGLK